MHISAISRFSPIVLTTLKKHASLSTARSIEKPIPIVDESQISVYRSLRDQVNFVSSLPAPTAPIVFPNGFAIMPTAASGGGDIRCAMDFALNLSQMGVVGIKVIILEGPNRGENDHIINSVLRSPKYENIPVFRAADLPADFVVPDVILAGPGANKDTEGRIGRLFANYSPQPSYHYLQMEEPGFISGAYKFAKGSEKKIGLGIYDFEWGLPVQAGLGRPIASLVDQNPARLLDLNNHWLRDQLLKGQAPEGYASNSLTALIYHHIDYVFARSVYMLASALKDNEKHIDIVAKVWVPGGDYRQVAYTLRRSFEPDYRGILGMLNKSILADLGIGEVEWIRPDEPAKRMTIMDRGKKLRIIDPFPLHTDDVDCLRDAAIPIQGISGLMSLSRNIELNKIPLLEVLPDNQALFKEILALAESIDPGKVGLFRYLNVSEEVLKSVPYEYLTEWNPSIERYVPTEKRPQDVDFNEKIPGTVGKWRPSRYQIIKGNRDECVESTEGIVAIGELMRSEVFLRQVETFNQFLSHDSVYPRLLKKISSIHESIRPSSEPDPSIGCRLS